MLFRSVKIKDDLSDMFLKWLGDEYDYLTSDEYMLEMAECNDVKFDEDGFIVDD